MEENPQGHLDSFLDSSDKLSDDFNLSQNSFLRNEAIPLFLKVNYDIRKIKVGLCLDEEFLILGEGF
jgi:hypothetical protein